MPKRLVLVTPNGETVSLRELARRCGIHYATVQHRWRKGTRDVVHLTRPVSVIHSPNRNGRPLQTRSQKSAGNAPPTEPLVPYRRARPLQLDYEACMVRLRV